MSKPIIKSSSYSSEEQEHQHSVSDKPLSHDYPSNAEYHQVDLDIIKEEKGHVDSKKSSFFLLYPCKKENASIESIFIYLILDLILAHFLYRTVWIIQATLITPSYSILYFLGAYCPLIFCIYKIFYEKDLWYGNQYNSIYFFYTCIQLAFLHGIAWSIPSIYNSSYNSLFSFFLFLILAKSLTCFFELIILLCWKQFRVKWLSWSLELIGLCVYVACLFIQVKDSTNLSLVYVVWTAAIVVDMMTLFYRQWTWDVVVLDSDSTQSYLSNSTRLSVSLCFIFCIGMGHLFQLKTGVGMPDYSVSVNYNVWCYLCAIVGFFILYALCRCYLEIICPVHLSLTKKWQILWDWLHLCLIGISLILIAGLELSLKNLWNHLSLNGNRNFFNQFNLQKNGIQFSIWPSLPVPVGSVASQYLSQWVSQVNFTSYPPSALSYESHLSGTSKVEIVNNHPDSLVGCACGLALIIFTLLELLAQLHAGLNLLQRHILLIHIYRTVLAIVYISLSFIDIFILWKLLILCVGLLILLILSKYSTFVDDSKK